MTGVLERLAQAIPPEWGLVALVAAFFGVLLVVGLFAYLDRRTRRRYFRFWMAGWLFYAVYLGAAIGLAESPALPALIMVRRACIGISALFMFWGTFVLTNRERKLRELGWGVVFILIWSYLAAYEIHHELWITLPVFVLLGSSGVYTGLWYMRCRNRSHGTAILGAGFLLWGAHLAVFPLLDLTPALTTAGYFSSAALAVLITVGMVVEQQLTLSEQHYRTLFDSASDAIFLLATPTLKVIGANQAALQLTGRARAELIGRQFADLCVERFQSPGGGECHIRRADGTTVPCEARTCLADCPSGSVMQVNVRDISERRRAEAELRQTQQQVIQQQRLSALGQMASGIAHDFNNVLTRIMGFNELLLAHADRFGAKDQQYLRMINAAAKDAAAIVMRLREFYRPRAADEKYGVTDLNRLVDEAVALTRPRWKYQAQARGATIAVQQELAAAAPLHGDESELREVLINLLSNAADAISQAGTITVRTRCDSGNVWLEVSDTGTGMTDEVRQRCFEPFFTTRGEPWNGLGLAIVYGIVQRHGGTIEVQSTVGQGTTIRLHLPQQPSLPAAQTTGQPPEPLRALHVLLVEDEPEIRVIETEYLTTDGHLVEPASNGAEGWQKFQAGQFDVVLADRAMPEMNGDQLAAAVKRLSPRTPVVLITGFGDALRAHGTKPPNVNLLLPKPVTETVLRQALRQVMAGC